MRRADRLLQIVQILRRNRRPTTADMLADELEVVPRTIYRDIVTLQSTGVPVRGEAGVGYVLEAGYDLPPLMFNAEEVEAIVLGALLVSDKNDPELAKAARDVVAKISSVLPSPMREQMDRSALLVPHLRPQPPDEAENLPLLRKAVRSFRKLAIAYEDANGDTSDRTIWPLGLAYFTTTTLVCSWCELRNDFRVFRADRVRNAVMLEEKFNGRNGALLAEFLENDRRT